MLALKSESFYITAYTQSNVDIFKTKSCVENLDLYIIKGETLRLNTYKVAIS